jgi:hypothetical protein
MLGYHIGQPAPIARDLIRRSATEADNLQLLGFGHLYNVISCFLLGILGYIVTTK